MKIAGWDRVRYLVERAEPGRGGVQRGAALLRAEALRNLDKTTEEGT